MNATFVPILVVPAVPFEGGIRFLHRETQIDIGSEVSETLWKLLSYANGYNSIASIAKLARVPENDAIEIFAELCEMELVVDSREQFVHFQRISNFPSAFNSDLSQDEIVAYTDSARLPVKDGEATNFTLNQNTALNAIREKRRSCRSFYNREMSADQIGSICNYAYSINDHSVPSGGALYPLKIYVLIEEPQAGLSAGYYEYDAESDKLILFNDEVDTEQLKYCFNQEEMPFGSSVQILIAADMKRHSRKYANRGYRLTLIEVGHAAENISLYCAEQGLGACELGGVQDEPMKAELELDGDVWPLLAVAVGYPSDDSRDEFNKVRYVEENVGDGHIVNEVWVDTFGKDSAFFGAASAYKDKDGELQFAGATSPSYADAVFKATIEGYERWLSGQVRVDFHGSAKELDGLWIHPKLIAPLTDEQAVKSGVTPFSDDLPIDWTKGKMLDGTAVYVPSDIVFYGQASGENRIYFSHSSGIAAYTDYQEAEKRALVELIERDALMRSWYMKQSPKIVGESLLPVHAKKRIIHWEKQNRRLIILQMPSEYGWVFEAVFVSEEYPCFVSGAAATIDCGSIESAINKAIQEAEYGLLMTLKEPEVTKIDPRKVVSPSDHGDVYYFSENAKKIDWLYTGETECAFMNPKYFGYKQLCEVLKVVIVDLSEQGSMLKVVRALSSKLVPINFGFHSAHYTHPALEGKVHPDSLTMPHYFA